MTGIQAAAPTPGHNKIQAFEGLRALMAWWVVLGHISHTIGLEIPLIGQNAVAVDVFIILSGFVIFRLIDLKRESYGSYITRRAFRIFPLYLLVLVVSAALLPLQSESMAEIPFRTDRNGERYLYTLAALGDLRSHLLIHIPLLQGLVPDQTLPGGAYTLVGQAWSVSLEWQFYLVAPFAFAALLRPKRWAALAAAMAVLVAIGGSINGAFLGSKLLLFAVGIGSYLLVRADGRRGAGGVLALTIALAGLAVASHGGSAIASLMIWVAVLASTLPGPRWPLERLNQFLGSPPLVYAGERSYSVYLIHMIPLYVAVHVLNGLDLSAPAYAVALLGAVVVATLSLSIAAFAAVERPGIALGATLARRFPYPKTARPAASMQ